MQINQFDNYIFDLDGTIINSSQEVLLCFKKAFENANCHIDNKSFTSDVIGPPLKQILKLLAPDLEDNNKISEIISNFRLLYDNDENDKSFLYDGIYELLTDLKNKGKRLFIATLKPEIPTKRLLALFGLNMFEDVYTIDKNGKQMTKTEMIEEIIAKYELNKSATVMIGDAPSDMISAKEAGIKGIGVLWGYGRDKTKLIEYSDKVIEKSEICKI